MVRVIKLQTTSVLAVISLRACQWLAVCRSVSTSVKWSDWVKRTRCWLLRSLTGRRRRKHLMSTFMTLRDSWTTSTRGY